jgi:hypothetical protein
LEQKSLAQEAPEQSLVFPQGPLRLETYVAFIIGRLMCIPVQYPTPEHGSPQLFTIWCFGVLTAAFAISHFLLVLSSNLTPCPLPSAAVTEPLPFQDLTRSDPILTRF